MRSILLTLIAAAVLFPLMANAIDVSGDQWGTWTKDNSPYNVVGEIRVPPESTLVIEPGVLVHFQGHYKFIVDSLATLLAEGTESDSIKFTAKDQDSGWHGIRFIYANSNCRISHCCLQGGKGVGSGVDNFGGAIYCYHSSPTITNSTITANSAYLGGGGIFCRGSSPAISNNKISGNLAYGVHSKGGGIYCVESSGTISNNTIIDNSANYYGTGGGIYCWESSPTISDNTISGNSADLDFGRGGGISCDKFSSPIVSNNIISGNSAYWYGGGIDCYNQSSPTIEYNTISGNFAGHGGGIYCEDSSPTIRNNTVHENEGCGIHCYYHSSPTISNNSIKGNPVSHPFSIGGGGICCQYHSSPTIRNNTIIGNSVLNYGGGILCTNFCYPIISNNTIWGNSAGYGGGIGSKYQSNPRITNTILWADTATSGPEIYLLNSDITITYSNVQGGWPGQGNIDVHPLFRDPENHDFHLTAVYCGDPYNSPCIDAGHLDSLDVLLDCFHGLGTDRADMAAYGGRNSGWPTGIDDDESSNLLIPKAFLLHQNYPNQFNANTVISYQLPTRGHVKLEIYNLSGQKVATLIDNEQEAGYKSVNWGASTVSSGLYFYKLTAGDLTETKRMMLVK